MSYLREKTPWEHHASASGLPRFNYKAPSSTDSLKGFLITCPLDREKSATMEAMPLITKQLKSPNLLKSLGASGDESTGSDSSTLQSNKSAENGSNKDALNLKRSRAEFEIPEADDDKGVYISKLARKGIVSIFWDSSKTHDPVTVLSNIFADKGSRSSLRWCERMIPVQASCVYSRENLSALVTKLVMEYLGNSLPTEKQPLKYAVSFNRHGFEAKEVDKSTNDERLDRMSCIHLVTAAMANAAPHTVVDLLTPQMVVIVEVIPFAGVQSHLSLPKNHQDTNLEFRKRVRDREVGIVFVAR
ncbi:hypothetical protein GOP47_0018834 [Adiantum capillus-veneris]|uniref:THUMP domain-containing protein n=1 Tax=Adiantum capillus-veneris TaxID=13818 RepID=A0A9D4UEA3_ADICA|nr:hypothetical protein GOP47_0018834 [Adiantum capillus-veneris]